jgi:Ca2+-binding RTX toxin-like protein
MSVTIGTTGRDTLSGTIGGADSIDGRGGGDLIYGYAATEAAPGLWPDGNDTIFAYAGDTIFGAAGADLFITTVAPWAPAFPMDLTGAYLDGGNQGNDQFGWPWQDTFLTSGTVRFGTSLPFFDIERLATGSGSFFRAIGSDSADVYVFGTSNDIEGLPVIGTDMSIIQFSNGALAALELSTGGGNDTVIATSQALANYIYGGNDRDFIYGLAAPDFLYGDDGDDTLSGGSNNDELYGGGGADSMIGGLGADTFFGGEASDTYVVLPDDMDLPAELMAEGTDGIMSDGSRDMIFEERGEGSDTIYASVSYTMTQARTPGPFLFSYYYAEIEALILTGSDNINGTGNSFAQLVQGNSGNNRLDGGGGADSLLGAVGDDTIFGGSGTASGVAVNDNDSLQGGAGNDWLTGDIGNDTIDGGSGADWASYASASTGVTIDLASGFARGGHDEDRLVDVEAAMGGIGNDQFWGDAGDNTLSGGAGADTMDGRSGNDLFYVDNSLDRVFELAQGGSETIITSVSYALPDNVEQIVIADGVTGIAITGSSGADVIIGNGRANTFNGGAGDDIILAQNIAVQDILALFAFP